MYTDGIDINCFKTESKITTLIQMVGIYEKRMREVEENINKEKWRMKDEACSCRNRICRSGSRCLFCGKKGMMLPVSMWMKIK